jgi:hypothetical protein
VLRLRATECACFLLSSVRTMAYSNPRSDGHIFRNTEINAFKEICQSKNVGISLSLYIDLLRIRTCCAQRSDRLYPFPVKGIPVIVKYQTE